MPDNRISLYEFLLLTVVVTALTLGAAWLYPIWDDARLLVLIKESGISAIRLSLDGRVLVSVFFIFLSNHQLFFPIGLIFHWIGWLGMGLVTMRLWRVMFPAHARFALLPALFSVAPVLCKIQFVIMSVVFIDLIGPVLGFLGILMLFSEQSSSRRKIGAGVVALLLIVFSILISEYGVATAGAGFVLLTAKAIRQRPERKRESYRGSVNCDIRVGFVRSFLTARQINSHRSISSELCASILLSENTGVALSFVIRAVARSSGRTSRIAGIRHRQ